MVCAQLRFSGYQFYNACFDSTAEQSQDITHSLYKFANHYTILSDFIRHDSGIEILPENIDWLPINKGMCITQGSITLVSFI